ncbi:MAG: hypothetical protein U0271_34195 [Polyangiaceae bacterium]
MSPPIVERFGVQTSEAPPSASPTPRGGMLARVGELFGRRKAAIQAGEGPGHKGRAEQRAQAERTARERREATERRAREMLQEAAEREAAELREAEQREAREREGRSVSIAQALRAELAPLAERFVEGDDTAAAPLVATFLRFDAIARHEFGEPQHGHKLKLDPAFIDRALATAHGLGARGYHYPWRAGAAPSPREPLTPNRVPHAGREVSDEYRAADAARARVLELAVEHVPDRMVARALREFEEALLGMLRHREDDDERARVEAEHADAELAGRHRAGLEDRRHKAFKRDVEIRIAREQIRTATASIEARKDSGSVSFRNRDGAVVRTGADGFGATPLSSVQAVLGGARAKLAELGVSENDDGPEAA